MKDNFDMEYLLGLVEMHQFRRLKELSIEMNEVDVTSFMEELDSEKTVAVSRMLPKKLATDVFACLSLENQQYVINSVTDMELRGITGDPFVDDMVDILEELPASVVKRMLQNTSSDTRKLISQFLQYPENSVGNIMIARHVGLKKTMAVGEAFIYIRKHGVGKEMTYTCHVMGGVRRLEGVATVKDLLMSPYDTRIEDIMGTHAIKAVTAEDQEDVVESFHRYGLLSLPVVNYEERLVGIVTVNDIVDVMEQETTKDFEKMAAMVPGEKPHLKASVSQLAKNRIVWLLVLMISSMITEGILGKYENIFAIVPLLVTSIPMLADTGGNAGSQNSILIIRGMAVGEIKPRDVFRAAWRELRMGAMVGVVLSAANYIRLVIIYPGNEMICSTVVLSLFVTVVLAKTIGCMLPVTARICRMGSVITAAPLVTTIVGILSLVIYFRLACRLLNLTQAGNKIEK